MMKDQCKHCDGDGKIRAPNPDDRFYITAPCRDCGGTGYDPLVTLPAKVVEALLTAVADYTAAVRRASEDDLKAAAEAVRLAQEAP